MQMHIRHSPVCIVNQKSLGYTQVHKFSGELDYNRKYLFLLIALEYRQLNLDTANLGLLCIPCMMKVYSSVPLGLLGNILGRSALKNKPIKDSSQSMIILWIGFDNADQSVKRGELSFMFENLLNRQAKSVQFSKLCFHAFLADHENEMS